MKLSRARLTLEAILSSIHKPCMMQSRSILPRPLGRSLLRYIFQRQIRRAQFPCYLAASSHGHPDTLSMELTICRSRNTSFPDGVVAHMKSMALMQSASTARNDLGRRRYARANHLPSDGLMVGTSLLNGLIMRR